MKNLFFKAAMFLALPLMSLSFTSCSDDDDAPAAGVITPDQTALSFEQGAQSKVVTLAVQNVKEWKAEVNYKDAQVDWVSIERNVNELTVAVTENKGEARSAEVVITAQDVAPVRIAVSQAAFVFESELIGKYRPVTRNMQLPGATSPMDYSFVLDCTWNDLENAPTVDAGGIMGMPPGVFMLPVPSVLGMAMGFATPIVQGTLVELELTDKGRIAAKAHELVIQKKEDGSFDLATIMNPQFKPEISEYPSEARPDLPADAFGYYTEKGQLFFTISKKFITAAGQTLEQPMDLVPVLENLITEMGLNIVSTNDYFAVPLKYTLSGKDLEIFVTRDMIAPFVELLRPMQGTIPSFAGINIVELITLTYDNTSDMNVRFFLERI